MSITIIGTRTETLGFLSAKAEIDEDLTQLPVCLFLSFAACLIIHLNDFFTKQRVNMGEWCSWQLLEAFIFRQQKLTKKDLTAPPLVQVDSRIKMIFLKISLIFILEFWITLFSNQILWRKDYKFNLCSQILKLGRTIFYDSQYSTGVRIYFCVTHALH